MSYQSPPPPNPYGAPGGYGGAPAGNNQKAIWSLVTGIAGLCCCFLAAIPAIILSKMAKDEISRTGQQGSGMATAGLVLGIVSLAINAVYLILVATGVIDFVDFSFETS